MSRHGVTATGVTHAWASVYWLPIFGNQCLPTYMGIRVDSPCIGISAWVAHVYVWASVYLQGSVNAGSLVTDGRM